jgi:hypothetical protein
VVGQLKVFHLLCVSKEDVINHVNAHKMVLSRCSLGRTRVFTRHH